MPQETPPPARHRGPRNLVLVPVTILAAAALVYLATRPLGGSGPQASFFAFGSARPGVQIGQLAPGTAEAGAPDLGLIGIDGVPISLADLRGRPIWIVFWKTACEPCDAEAADVSGASAAHAGDQLAVIGIDVWDSSAAVKDYTATHPVAIPIAVAQGSMVMDAYGVWGAPTHYFIDRGGIIRDRYYGPMTRALIDESLRRII